MKLTFLLSTALAILTVAFLGHVADAGEAPQVVVLKLDDVVAYRSPDGSPVSPRWQRITDFFKASDIKASYGIIGFSLEEDNKAYFNWIKDLHKSGLIEFWNHGYRNRKATDKTGEFEGPFEEQEAALEKTQKLAKAQLGIELRTFGPHWSGTNEATAKALDGIPEIKMWFYGPKGTTKFVFPRFLTLENPTHVVDFAKFKAAYDRVGYDKECLALQGHPNSWNDERWANFVKIIDFLKSKGCVFMTPSEYMVKVEAPKATGAKISFKGWELYIWQRDGGTQFSLLPGTNRLKTDAEIAQAAVKGLDAIKPKLDELKEGQSVFVRGRRLAAPAPDDQAKAVTEYCRKIGLKILP